MKYYMYGIYDKKTQVYMPPFTAINQGDAVREIMNLLTKDTKFTQFPDDYDLIELGSFNDSSGMIIGLTERKFICNLRTLRDEIIQRKEKDQLRLFGNSTKQETENGKTKDNKENN